MLCPVKIRSRLRRLWLATAALLAATCLAGPTSPARAQLPQQPCPVGLPETLCGDGGQATAAALLEPEGLAVQGDGFLIADTGNEAVRRVRADGTITTIAGLGTAGFSGDGGLAAASQLNRPEDVSLTQAGSVLIADTGNSAIRRVTRKGVIVTAAGAAPGSAAPPPLTTPAPATEVALSKPEGVAALMGGGFLIADSAANQILAVDRYGMLRVVAGSGAAGDSGDGGPATAARLNAPTRVTPTGDGGFLVLDLGNGHVRRVSPAGIITTVPGVFTAPAQGIGGAANPGGIAIDGTGNIYVDVDHQVQRIPPDGVQTPVAGTEQCGNEGDGGAALAAELNKPAGLALTPDGDLLIDDISGGFAGGNVRLLLRGDQTITTAAGTSNTQGAGCIGAGGGPTGALWPFFYIIGPRGARAFRPIRLTFLTSRRAQVRTSLMRGGRVIRIRRRQAHPGSNTVTLRGVSRGVYTMRILGDRTLPNNNVDAGGTLHVPKRFVARLRVR